MKPSERREAIYAELRARRYATINEFAEEFKVNEKTIRRDIEELTLTYPVETVRGRYGGGIKLADWYYPICAHFSTKQMALLKKLAPTLKGSDLETMNSIISQFAP